jgi:peptidoglycan hydrolase-like protein with peptidoglycan-binding domain
VTISNIAPGSISLWRPLSGVQTESHITPRILVFHTMVGGLRGTENYFKHVNGEGYSGTESTWGVGGSWDGDLDGVAYQWQGTRFSADAQFEANAWCSSVETSDGGHYPTPEWSDKQLAKLIEIGGWWCKETGTDPVVAKSYDGHGLGFHQLFSKWNKNGHNCPGPLRRAQFYDHLLPGVVKIVNGHVDPPKPPVTHPAFPLGVGRYFGKGDVHSGHNLDDWQRQMRKRGWTIGVDGVYGPQTESVARAFQREKHLTADGLVGRQTWDAAWTAKVTA